MFHGLLPVVLFLSRKRTDAFLGEPIVSPDFYRRGAILCVQEQGGDPPEPLNSETFVGGESETTRLFEDELKACSVVHRGFCTN